MGAEVRLNTYVDSVGTAGVLTFETLEPQTAFQRHDQVPRRGPETHCGSPRASPFKAKAVAVSLAVTGGWTAPVFGGLGAGADAPKLRHKLL